MATPPSDNINPSAAAEPFEFRWSTEGNDGENVRNALSWTNWDALLKIAKELSGDETCAYEGAHCLNDRYLHRRIKLAATGRLWLARVPAQYGTRFQPDGKSQWSDHERQIMESEISTMKYVALKTKIPVPEVYGHNAHGDGNPVGWPWMLIECIRGNNLWDLGFRGIGTCESPTGTKELKEEQKAKLRKALASIQVQLANVPTAMIGTLMYEPDGSLSAGKMPAKYGHRGPFTSAPDWCAAWATDYIPWIRGRFWAGEAQKPGERHAREVFLRRLASEIHLITPDEISKDYVITLYDFDVSNVLVNDDLELVGIVNWEMAFTIPVEVSIAMMNMYAGVKKENATAVYDEEAMQFIAEVTAAEAALDAPRKISDKYGSVFGDIGVCMMLWNHNVLVNYEAAIDRAPKLV